MTLRNFIKQNRPAIDAAINKVLPDIHTFNDEARRMWILNDEGLYKWAKREGVNI